MAASRSRAVQKTSGRRVLVEEADNIEPGQDNVTVLPKQLTRLAMQKIDTNQNHEKTLPLQVYLQSQGLQGLTNNSPNNSLTTDVYNFNVKLSNMNNDSHQGQPTLIRCHK